ncbi:MAG: tripartite tricarboxylate transporter substrate binding protein [Noviherbaspirillum sp.]|jgi:tripartite-type tricarboxylate transporter receptor subunit TctC|nr:tripartite tricarboxylate transporter substrate binding protein [Noviherbaspirillum sp.]MDB5794194.1 tripartite tricarboxylate transporter substrate binding protein [Noviherbaspirillum sp.]
MKQRRIIQLISKTFAVAALFSAAQMHAIAQDAANFPSKPLRIIVPFTPGGSNDVLARIIGQKLGQTWKQPVVVENKPGAGGNIGAELVARSPADGYTTLIAANSLFCINPAMYSKMSFDPVKDFAPITMLGTVPVVLVVAPTVQAKNVKELIAQAKAQPGAFSYASAGLGSPQHLSAELFKARAGVDMLHVPYKGAAPAVSDLLSGQVQVLFGAINSVLPYIKSGRLRALAVGGSQRSSDLPDVPTIAESAVPGYLSEIFIGLVAPAGTSKGVIEKMGGEVRKILAEPDTREKLAQQGIEAHTGGADEMAKLIAADCARWPKLIKDINLKGE